MPAAGDRLAHERRDDALAGEDLFDRGAKEERPVDPVKAGRGTEVHLELAGPVLVDDVGELDPRRRQFAVERLEQRLACR